MAVKPILVLLAALWTSHAAVAGIMLGIPEGGIPNDVTLPVSSTPVGAVGVNAYTGWTNPADTAANDSNWTSPSTSIRYLYPTDSKYPIATTVGQWRDVEVTTWMRRGCVLLRWSGTTAVYFIFNEETDTFSAGVRTGINPGGVQSTDCPNSSASVEIGSFTPSSIPGYSTTDTAAQTYTFGCAGWECYAEFNGVEFWRSETDIRWPMLAGAAALSTPNTSYGFRDTSVHWLPLTTIYSNPTVALYDMRDFGIKSVETTGSITSGSDELTVADASGFAIGDDVIVECGTEAGACALGTVGVGGTWPAAHYANDAAMDAAVPCTASSYAYLDDSNKVRRCASNGASWEAWDSTRYFTNTKTPRALAATITGIAGSVLTLDTSASATATNAGVYYDSSAYMEMFGDGSGNSSFFPIGTYLFPENTVIAGQFSVYLRDGANLNNGPKVVGVPWSKAEPHYTFYTPDGSQGIGITVTNTDYATVQNILVRSNGGTEKFGLFWTDNGVYGTTYPIGINYYLGSYGAVIDSGARNTLGAAVQCAYCSETNFIRPYARVTYRAPIYIGNWKLTQTDSTGGSIVDGEVDSDWRINGFELFRNDGGQLIRPVSRNGILAMNSSGGGWLIEDGYFLMEQNTDAPGTSSNSPIFDINSNIQPPSPSMEDGGTISNTTIINNYYNVSNDLPVAITVNQYNPNVTITGTYPSCDDPQGLIQTPGWASGTNSFWGIGVRTSGDNTVISGMRFVGDADYADGHGNIHTEGGSGKTVTVTDNVMDHGATGNSTIIETGTISNATYEGMCP